MKKILSCTKTAIILLIVTILALGFYTYMLARPISYGMSYCIETEFNGIPFEGTLKFSPDGTLINQNSNFLEAFETYYYYKNGYVFALMASTEEEYNAEVAYIEENFDEALATPFYASKINAFKQVAGEVDDFVTTYTCKDAVVFAIAGGAVALVLIALTVTTFALSKKAKCKE